MQALIMVGINLLIGVAMWGIGMLLRKPTHQQGPRVKDRDVQVSSYGVPKPILYGECKSAFELIYCDQLKEHRQTQSVGKGGGDTVTTYTYSLTFAGMFGITPDITVFGEPVLLKLWIDSKLAYNATADADKVVAAKAMKKFKFYSGTATQLPDPTLEGKLGAGNVPGYRHKSYGVFRDLGVTPYGNRPPTIRVLLAPGAASTPGVYPVTGVVRDANDDYGNDYPMGILFDTSMVLSQDEQWIVLGLGWWDAAVTSYFTWFLISTASRKVVAQRTYSEPDFGTSYCDATDYLPYYYAQSIDMDEQGFVYAAACEGYGKIHRLDMQTFTIQAVGPEVNPYSVQTERLLVSRNPLHPYLWAWFSGVAGYDYVWLIDRDTLASPFDAASYGHEFVSPEAASFPDRENGIIAGAVNHGDGSLYVFWDVYDSPGGGNRTYYIVRLYPDGRREEWDVTSHFTGYSFAPLDLMTYDANSDQLLINMKDGSNNEHIFFLDASVPTTLNGISGANEGGDEYAQPDYQRGVYGEYFYVTRYADMTILKINVATREVEDTYDISSVLGGNPYPYIYGGLYVHFKSSMFVLALDGGVHMQEVSLGRLVTGTVGLDDVVSDICKRAGLQTAQLNVAQLTDAVKGYMVADDQAAREALEPLMECFVFDGVETDGVLTFVKRGGASVATVPEADLGARIHGEALPEPLEIEFPNENELPRRVEVEYPDQDRKHEPGLQFAERQVTDSTLVSRFGSKILLDKDDAKQLAEIKLKYDWLTKPCSLSLGPKYAKFMPTDVVTVQKTEGDYRIALLEGSREGLLTNWRGLVEDLSFDYSSIAEGNPGPDVDEDVEFAGPSLYQLMDLPPLLDAHDTAGVYMASGAYYGDWAGCNIYVSKDSGDSWVWLQDLGTRATTGVATTALADFAYRCLDNGNSVTVRWDYSSDALTDKTTAEFWNGQAHYLLVGEEIICVKDVTTNGDGTQTFGPPLIRGARGTEYAMTGHAAGEKVVVLSTSTVVFTPLDSSYLNQSYLYNGVSHGGEWEDGWQRLFTTELRTLKPWAGTNPTGSRDGSNNLTIYWDRRDRFGHLNPLRAGTEVPMSEDTESYEVDILLSGTVVRTITGLSDESASYSAAEQTTDGITPGAPVDCEIYQLSAITGRGWELAATV